ncbi:MAG: hemin uptake protein HemP [Phycisphaerales bacterium]|jgi:hemin uptake protein HemP|nr:hemin uptake protein HemP [Phycisphaerales bacterium]
MNSETHEHTAPPGLPRRNIIDAEQLLGETREVRLRFGAQEYRLSITRNQKLILTK